MIKKELAEQTTKYSPWQLIMDVLALVKPYKGRFILASFIQILTNIAALYPAFAIASIVTFLAQYEHRQSLNPLWRVFGAWVVIIVARSFGQYASQSLGRKIAEKVAIDSTLKTIQHMILLDMVWH